jgi:hypothetical protein
VFSNIYPSFSLFLYLKKKKHLRIAKRAIDGFGSARGNAVRLCVITASCTIITYGRPGTEKGSPRR